MRLIVIAGPTASGKSALALDLAQREGGEIVSADSQQVYRFFDIGTAKPTAEELAMVPHHLISVVDPLEPFSAGRYQALADAAIADIVGRGKQPILVGGTGLYLRVLLHGVVDAPPRDDQLRAKLESEAEELGRPALHERLRQIDSETADAISPNDLVRIIRGLEIHALTGESASAHRARHGFQRDRYAFDFYVLNPPREQLYAAINARMKVMFEHGLLDEVRSLIDRGYRDAAPMKSVGYAEALEVVEERMSREVAVEKAAQATRNYAKRQFTWFRKEPGARFIAPPYVLER